MNDKFILNYIPEKPTLFVHWEENSVLKTDGLKSFKGNIPCGKQEWYPLLGAMFSVTFVEHDILACSNKITAT